MRQPYKLASIPPFRGYEVKITASTSTSSCSSATSEMTHSESSSSLAASVDDDQVAFPSSSDPPHAGKAGHDPALTSFQAGKRRLPALEKLSLGPTQSYPLDPNGASALPPPSPLIHGEIFTDRRGGKPSSPTRPISSLYKALKGGSRTSLVPLRFQPKRVSPPKVPRSPSKLRRISVDENDPSRVLMNPAPSSDRVAQPQFYFNDIQNSRVARKPTGVHALSLTNKHLTPPPTPNSRQQQGGDKIGKKGHASHDDSSSIEARLPPTPSTSPVNRIHSTSAPTTVSAKALSLHRLHPLFDRSYCLGDELGSGGFGFVVQAIRRSDGLVCAVKFIYKDKVPQGGWVKDEVWGDEDDTNAIMRTADGIKRVPLEAYVLKTIEHRGVVDFVDLFEDSRFAYLVMEHHGTSWNVSDKGKKSLPPLLLSGKPKHLPAKKQPLQPLINNALVPTSESRANSTKPALAIPALPGPMLRRSSCDLFECIEHHIRLPEGYAKYVFAQLVDVVGCLHYNGFAHRDIKDENIVIDDDFRVKLIDFGSALIFDYRKEPPTLSRFFGTLNFAAPEVLKKGYYQPLAAEIWSMGILLSILVTGESLFRDVEAIKSYRASAPNLPVSEDCLDLIFHCLALNPADRWNCFQMRSHPWLADCDWPWSDLPPDAALEGISLVRK